MFEILVLIAFAWLFWKTLGLTFRISWGVAKTVAVALFSLALPVLAVCLMVAGGVMLLLPLALVALAWGILKTCIL